jgi:hypothetical protein
VGHHPHSLEDPKPVVDFIISHFRKGYATLNPVTEKSRIAEIAKKEYGFKPVKVHSVTWEDGYWRVMLVRLPETPGGHVTYKISAEGKVIQVIPGM